MRPVTDTGNNQDTNDVDAVYRAERHDRIEAVVLTAGAAIVWFIGSWMALLVVDDVPGAVATAWTLFALGCGLGGFGLVIFRPRQSAPLAALCFGVAIGSVAFVVSLLAMLNAIGDV